jgi:multiple sugar transport system permease protein
MRLTARARNVVLMMLIVGAVIMLMPWLWAIGGSLSPAYSSLTGGIFPSHPVLSNFTGVFAGTVGPVWRWLANSVFVSIAAATLVVVVDTLAAYGLARLRFAGRRVVFSAVLVSLVVPFVATLVPLYLEFDQFNLLDTYWALILPVSGSAFGVFLLFQFFRQLPLELEEAARVDGAQRLGILRHVAIPLAMPAIATLWILSFIQVYNDFFWPLVSTSSTNMRTITVGISVAAIGQYSTNDALLLALTFVSIVPMLLAFIFAQRRLVAGLSAGGLVG